MAIRKHKSFKQKKAERIAAKAEVENEVKNAPVGDENTQDAGANESDAPKEGASSSDNPGASDSPEKAPDEEAKPA